MKVLCTGDIHIGKIASRLPSSADPREYSTAAMWERIVAAAVTEHVDVVLLSGDVVDKDNRYFEAIGAFERGLQKLHGAGIETYAVSGNHDFQTLPRIASMVDGRGFRLIGRNGRWERVTIDRGHGPVFHIDGWSFPKEHVTSSALATYDRVRDGDAPVIGLLHCDLDQPKSNYGPVTSNDLRRLPVDLWQLGHIHRPGRHEQGSDPCLLYPGSPMGMDPSESGVHGVWLCEINPGMRVLPSQLPLSPIRYRTFDVDVTTVTDQAGFEDLLVREIQRRFQDDIGGVPNDPVSCVSCTLNLTGTTRLHRSLPRWVDACRDQLELSIGDVICHVHHVTYAADPGVDLLELSRGRDPVGEFARLILALERDEELRDPHDALLQSLKDRLSAVASAPTFPTALEEAMPGDESIRQIAKSEAMRALALLMSQKAPP